MADQKRQLAIRKVVEQAFVPERCAFGSRRLVAAVLSGTRITKSHGEKRDSFFIVEDRAIQLDPIAQAVAARVVPSNSTCSPVLD
jgi:hypothetical protein